MFSNHELEDVGMVYPHHFHKLGIPSLNMVVCSFVSFCVDILHVHGDFYIFHQAMSPQSTHLTLLKFLSGTHLHQSRPPLMDISWMDMK